MSVKAYRQFHINAFPPIKDNWPNGGFSLYEISADTIAQRIGFDADGKVNRRDGWSGYVGTYSTLDSLLLAIAERVK